MDDLCQRFLSALDSSLQRAEDVPVLGANKAVAGPNPCACIGRQDYGSGLSMLHWQGPVQATGKFPVGNRAAEAAPSPNHKVPNFHAEAVGRTPADGDSGRYRVGGSGKNNNIRKGPVMPLIRLV